MEKLLEFRGIGKYFPGVKALAVSYTHLHRSGDGEAANSRCQKPAVTGRYIRLKSAYRSAVNIHGFCSPDGQPAIRR